MSKIMANVRNSGVLFTFLSLICIAPIKVRALDGAEITRAEELLGLSVTNAVVSVDTVDQTQFDFKKYITKEVALTFPLAKLRRVTFEDVTFSTGQDTTIMDYEVFYYGDQNIFVGLRARTKLHASLPVNPFYHLFEPHIEENIELWFNVSQVWFPPQPPGFSLLSAVNRPWDFSVDECHEIEAYLLEFVWHPNEIHFLGSPSDSVPFWFVVFKSYDTESITPTIDGFKFEELEVRRVAIDTSGVRWAVTTKKKSNEVTLEIK